MDDKDGPISLDRRRRPPGRYEKATDLFAEGKFVEMRDALGTRGDPYETHLLLNFLRTLPREGSKMPQGHFSRRLNAVERGTVEYHEALFTVLKEAGFTTADRPSIEQYFTDVRTENERSRESGAVEGELEQQRLQRLNEVLGNAAKALDKVFPREAN